MDQLFFDFQLVVTGVLAVSGAAPAVERLLILFQFSVIPHSFFFHPVILKIHFKAEHIVDGHVLRTGLEAFLAADSAVLIFGLTLVFRDHI